MIEDIRNHLAAHDRRLSFLFGAGTSSSINIAPAPAAGQKPKHEPLIPGIEALTEVCGAAVGALGTTQAAAWSALVKQCEQNGRRADVEGVLSRVRIKIDAIGDGETLVGLGRDQLVAIESTICSAIAKKANPPEDKIPIRTPHGDFASWIKKVNRTAPLEIFTTNYDILLERAFEASRVAVFDGFVGTHCPFFYPECLEDDALLPTPRWVRLWKLHGSVSWRLQDEGKDKPKRIVRSQPAESGEMILPSNRKYDESRKQPYVAYMDRLSRILNAEHALLVAVGCGFRDEHINSLLFGALDNRSTANVIALQFEELKESDEIVQVALRLSNLTVIGPSGGVISGVRGSWKLTQPVDNKTSSFMDAGFDSNALPENEGSPAAETEDLKGRMRLGDFYWFGRFLDAMRPDV